MTEIDPLVDKVLDVVEKSVGAWARTGTRLEELSKSIDQLTQEFKELNNLIRQKPCITETVHYAQLETKLLTQYSDIKKQQDSLLKKLEIHGKEATDTGNIEQQITLWLKLATGSVILIGTIIGALLAITK